MIAALCRDRAWLLSEEAFILYASCLYHPSYEKYQTQMEAFLDDPSVKVIVCEEQEKKTGMMVLQLFGPVARVIGIAVTYKLRNRGIGTHMIQFAVESEAVERIEAQTDDDAVGFYCSCGFHAQRIIVDYPDKSVFRYHCVLRCRS